MSRTTNLRFPGASGAELAARLTVPGEPPRAYALLAHCFTCSKDLRVLVTMARELAAAGIAVMRFDFTGLGESDGEFSGTTFTSNVEDLVAASKFLAEHHAPPALLIGHSFGGAAAIQAAARIRSATALATIAAPADPSHVGELLADSAEEIRERGEAEVSIGGRRFTIGRQFLEDLEESRMRETIGALDRALLVLHSPNDRVVEIENATRIFQAARHPKSFVSLDGAGHMLADPAHAQYAARVITAWAEPYLPEP